MCRIGIHFFNNLGNTGGFYLTWAQRASGRHQQSGPQHGEGSERTTAIHPLAQAPYKPKPFPPFLKSSFAHIDHQQPVTSTGPDVIETVRSIACVDIGRMEPVITTRGTGSAYHDFYSSISHSTRGFNSAIGGRVQCRGQLVRETKTGRLRDDELLCGNPSTNQRWPLYIT